MYKQKPFLVRSYCNRSVQIANDRPISGRVGEADEGELHRGEGLPLHGVLQEHGTRRTEPVHPLEGAHTQHRYVGINPLCFLPPWVDQRSIVVELLLLLLGRMAFTFEAII